MVNVRSPWRVLRPVLLAGAATLTWLTFSASGATADSSTDAGPLGGSLTASISSLSAPLTGQVDTAPTPVVPVPVAPTPSGAFPTDSAPVIAVVDQAAAELLNTVAPPLAEAVPVLEPVVQPVADLVNGVNPLPISVPELPNLGVDVIAGVDVTDAAVAAAPPSAGSLSTGAGVAGSGAALASTGDGSLTTSASWQAWAGTAFTASLANSGMQPVLPHLPRPGDPSPTPAPVPVGPSSGAGSGSSSTSSPGFAAWVDAFGLYLPLAGTYPISGFSEHVPSPVSFDPGSSPD